MQLSVELAEIRPDIFSLISASTNPTAATHEFNSSHFHLCSASNGGHCHKAALIHQGI